MAYEMKAYYDNIGSEPNTMTIEFRRPIQRRPLRTCHRGRGFAEPRNPLPRDRTTVDIIGSVEHRRTIGCVAKGSHHAGFLTVRIYNYGTTFEEFKSAYRSSERRTKRRSGSQGKIPTLQLQPLDRTRVSIRLEWIASGVEVRTHKPDIGRPDYNLLQYNLYIESELASESSESEANDEKQLTETKTAQLYIYNLQAGHESAPALRRGSDDRKVARTKRGSTSMKIVYSLKNSRRVSRVMSYELVERRRTNAPNPLRLAKPRPSSSVEGRCQPMVVEVNRYQTHLPSRTFCLTKRIARRY
jgi:hypothetical protein